MRLFANLICFCFVFAQMAVAGETGDAYGTIVYADGSMTAIHKSRKIGRSFVTHFDTNGKVKGKSCNRESVEAYQIRKAYMKAKSSWRPGYVPMKRICHEMF